MARHTVLFLFLSLAAGGGCSGENAPSDGVASPSYILWSEGSVRQSTIADVRGDVIDVCLRGQVSAADLQRAKDWTRRAVLTWLRALKVRDELVTSNVAFSCEAPDLTVNLRNGGGTSFASPSVATIYMTRPYGTWTHEFGHALAGLSDTYAGGAGSCQGGQPPSLMCWGAYGPRANPDEFSTLWVDDVTGIAANQNRVFEGPLTAPDWAGEVDLEAPLDLANPWPEAAAGVEAYPDETEVEVVAGGPTPIDLKPDTASIDL